MADVVRVGVVGTSGFTEIFHLPSIASHPAARLTAICGRNRERAELVAAEYGIPHVYTDYQELVASGQLDALVVVTHDAMHYPITMAALESGLHVLCEKAMALSVDQATQMRDKADAGNLVNMVNYTWRWVPPFNYVRHLLNDGYIGRCHHAHFQHQNSNLLDSAYNWGIDPQQGLGILGDLGSHQIDLARWYLGDIAAVSGHLTSLVDHIGPDGKPLVPSNDSALLAVQFTSGAQGTICVSGVSNVAEREHDFQVSLYGDAGSLEVEFNFAGARLRGVRRNEPAWHDLPVPSEFVGEGDNPPPLGAPFLAPFTNQSVGDRLFLDGIVQHRPVTPSFHDGWEVQRVIDAAFTSHKEGRWITIA